MRYRVIFVIITIFIAQGISMQNSVENGYKLYNDRKFEEAFEALYDAAAYENNAEAQYYIGLMYFHGDGVEKNIESAQKFWKKALQRGHIDAANQLSHIATSTKYMF